MQCTIALYLKTSFSTLTTTVLTVLSFLGRLIEIRLFTDIISLSTFHEKHGN